MYYIPYHIIRKEKLDSSQAYLSQLVQDTELPEGSLVITDHQWDGQGQEGNHWESEAGKNLTFSLLLRPTFISPSQQFILSKMISLAVLHMLSQVNGIKHQLAIKWPNDIYAGKYKLGGILLTHAVMGNTLEYSIVGIGLNINQVDFSASCPNPGSVKLETGSEQSLTQLTNSLLSSISEHYQLLKVNPGLIDKRYLDHLYQYMDWHTYEINSERVRGRICGLNEYGKLQLELADHTKVECDLKEIKYF